MIEIVNITPDFAIGPQISPDDLEALRAAGFASILNARPDGEQGDYPSAETMEEIARCGGFAYAHSPTENHAIFEPDVIDRFERALTELPKPVFAHCKSGTRAAILWALVESRHRDVMEVIALLRDAGQELDFLEDEMRESAKAARRSPFELRDDPLLEHGRSGLLGEGGEESDEDNGKG